MTHTDPLADALRGIDQCADAVHHALIETARTGAIPAIGDGAGVHDPAWCLAVEATCLVAAIRELRGRAPRKAYYA